MLKAGRILHTPIKTVRRFRFGELKCLKHKLLLATGLAFSASTAHAQQGSYEQKEREHLLSRISQSIRVTPDAACRLAQIDIQDFLRGEINRDGLIDNVASTVFSNNSEDRPTGLAALNEEVRRETKRRFDRALAVSRSETAVVGGPEKPAAREYHPSLRNITATGRLENGLECAADVDVETLRFPVAFRLWLSPEDADGWSAQGSFPTFTEADALSDSSPVRIDYGGELLTLAQAREKARMGSANALRAEATERKIRAAREAYTKSPAGRADAARNRQAMVEKQKACERNGGTWGVRFDKTTIMRVDAGTVSGLLATTQGCFFLRG